MPVPDLMPVPELVPVPDVVPVTDMGENSVTVPELESRWEYNLTLNGWLFMK